MDEQVRRVVLGAGADGTGFPPDDALPKGGDGKPARFWLEAPTTDFNVVLNGELVLVYDGGGVALGPGDTVVVQGGRHAWSNPGTKVAVLATVGVVDAPAAT